MRGFAFIALFSFLLLTLPLMYKGDIPIVKASPDIYFGDLVLNGNNVTLIENMGFDINGSIIITENATLILENSILNLTQASERQFNVTLENGANGNPRLLVYNSTLTSASGLEYLVYVKDNSTAAINNSTISEFLSCSDESTVTVLNSSYVDILYGYGSTVITVNSSAVREWHNYDSPQVEVYDSRINSLVTGSTSINCTISNLQEGNMSYWNFLSNCSVLFDGGYCPNVTLVNTGVEWWRFAFYGSSDARVIDSTIWEVSAIAWTGFTVVNLTRSSFTYVNCYGSNELWIDDSLIDSLYVAQLSTAWLLDTTCNSLTVDENASVYVNWYLDVYVKDVLYQFVPSANVTVTFPNMTVADSKLTDGYGWVRFALMEKMINTTAQYPIGNYSVQAIYLIHSNSTTVNMTANQQTELTFQDLVIPEFPSFLILPLFFMATLLAVYIARAGFLSIHQKS